MNIDFGPAFSLEFCAILIVGMIIAFLILSWWFGRKGEIR